ncbi:MAG: hypothetical protein KAI25_10160, partial [Hyphomicrobiaceae bacterium]|nr:hypothetical protein [Hyphomicrobiaceae bacterium]
RASICQRAIIVIFPPVEGLQSHIKAIRSGSQLRGETLFDYAQQKLIKHWPWGHVRPCLAANYLGAGEPPTASKPVMKFSEAANTGIYLTSTRDRRRPS